MVAVRERERERGEWIIRIQEEMWMDQYRSFCCSSGINDDHLIKRGKDGEMGGC